jgi:hypothetical protein
LHDAELPRVAERHGDAADGQVGVRLEVGADHLAVVHLVDMVAGQNQDVPRLLLLDRVDVLINGVGGALVPVLVDPLLRRQDVHVLAHFGTQEAPTETEVAIERAGLVLREDEHAAEAGIDAVGECEVDDPV